MSSQKIISLRKCVATNQMLPKEQLIRIVKTPENSLIIDKKGKLNGRGVYISPNLVAINLAKKNHCLERQLKIKLNDDFYQQLINEVNNTLIKG